MHRTRAPGRHFNMHRIRLSAGAPRGNEFCRACGKCRRVAARRKESPKSSSSTSKSSTSASFAHDPPPASRPSASSEALPLACLPRARHIYHPSPGYHGLPSPQPQRAIWHAASLRRAIWHAASLRRAIWHAAGRYAKSVTCLYCMKRGYAYVMRPLHDYYMSIHVMTDSITWTTHVMR